MNTFLKWVLTVVSGVAAGLVAYAQLHKGPPASTNDWWDLLIVTLTTSGIGTAAAAGRKVMDKVESKKNSD